MVYWTCVWLLTGGGCYLALQYGEVDALLLFAHLDDLTGLSTAQQLSPEMGNAAAAVAINEMLEPVRLPFVVVSTPTVVDTLLGRKRKEF